MTTCIMGGPVVPLSLFQLKNKLRQARKLIKNGWTKGIWFRKKIDYNTNQIVECYCSTGALRKVVGMAISPIHENIQTSQMYKDYEALERLLFDVIDFGDRDIRDIVSWNDKPGRTHKEVLDAFDKAIAA